METEAAVRLGGRDSSAGGAPHYELQAGREGRAQCQSGRSGGRAQRHCPAAACPHAVHAVHAVQALSEEEVFRANTLGWCIELVRQLFLWSSSVLAPSVENICVKLTVCYTLSDEFWLRLGAACLPACTSQAVSCCPPPPRAPEHAPEKQPPPGACCARAPPPPCPAPPCPLRPPVRCGALRCTRPARPGRA